jgi:predicted Zn-dependent peptidase
MVGVNVVVKVGSAAEDFATSGASHMLEHLLFNGTETRTQEQLYADVDRIGGYNNANTSRFYTNFMMLGGSEHLAEMMEIQADMLLHSVLPPAKLEKERGIVIEEIGQGRDDPAQAGEHFFNEKCFPGSPVALPVLGTPSTVAALRRETIWNHYKTYYVPNNMVMSVVGGFAPDSLTAVLDRYWATAPPRPLPERTENYSLPLTESRSYVRQGLGTTTDIRLALNAPAYGDPLLTPTQAAVTLLNQAFDRKLQDTAAAGVLSVDAQLLSWPPVGRLIIEAEIPPESDAGPVVEALLQALHGWAADLTRSLSPETLEAVAREAEADAAGLLEKPHYYGMMRAEQFALGDPDQIQTEVVELARLEPDAVIQAARNLIAGPVLTTVFVGRQQTATEDNTSAAQAVSTQRTVLDNGATLVVRTNPYAKVFAAHYLMRDRVLIEGNRHQGWIDLVHHLVAGQGGDPEGQKFQEALRSLGASLKAFDSPMIPYDDYYTSPRYSYLRLESLPRFGLAALELLDRRLRPLAPAQNALERVQQKAIATATRHAVSARSRSEELFDAAVIGEEHPLRRGTGLPPDPESNAELSPDALERVWAEAFDPANMVISVVSSWPADSIAAVLNRSLPATAAPATQRTWPGLPLTVERKRIDEELGKEQAYFRFGYVVKFDPAETAALRLATSVLSTRMADDLREKRGLAYSLGASVQILGDRAWVSAAGGTRPQNLDEFAAGLDAIVESLRIEGASEEEIEIARRALLGRMRMRLLSSMGQAYRLGTSEALHASYGWSQEQMQALAEVSTDAVNRAATRYLRTNPAVRVIVR